jgi:hypothetical protein
MVHLNTRGDLLLAASSLWVLLSEGCNSLFISHLELFFAATSQLSLHPLTTFE